MAERSETTPSQGELTIWLLRRVTRRYGAAVRLALDEAGHAQLPQQGFWAVNALEFRDRTAVELVDLMQITKQAVSQLIESLVSLEYVERHADPKDGRRVVLRLSDKGRAAASVIGAAAATVEHDMSRRLGKETLLELRRALEGFVDQDSSGRSPSIGSTS
jgi:DNA-binding MarR family transcriptional regulator